MSRSPWGTACEYATEQTEASDRTTGARSGKDFTVTTLLAIDGSIRCVGAAVFTDGKLTWTGAAHWGKRSTKTNPGERAYRLGVEMAVLMRMSEVTDEGRFSECIYEWPQAYGDDKNPNDLFGVLAISGQIVADHLATDAYTVKSYLPREWCGTIPKKVDGKLPRDPHTSPRAKKIAARLTEVEEITVFHAATTHDEIDAIGIGLHHLGRGILKRQRVYPGAT